jgi:hypothetical protein
MPTTEQDEPKGGPRRGHEKQEQREKRDAAIGRRVIHTLGRPGDLHEVRVRPLWGDHYRVNVLTGPDAFSATITHSYFVEADAEGNILRSTPAIVRHYPSPAGA